VFVIRDEISQGIGRKFGLAGTTQTKKQRRTTGLFIRSGRAVHGQYVSRGAK